MNIFKRSTLRQHIFSRRAYHVDNLVSTEGYIDYRSDTVTRPSQKMRDAMSKAVVGDDVYRDDPTVNHLQEEMAKLFGKEAALFVPSGTMSNLISMMVNVRTKGDGAILGHLSHIYNIERGGISALGSIHPMVVNNKPDGTMDLAELEYMIPPPNLHLPQPKVIALENSHNLCNGKVIRPQFVESVRSIANKYGLRMHLDAARGLNAAVYLNIDPKIMVKDFDTVNFCLSKGMGCPIGSLVIGSQQDIEFAMMIRKMLGGQMRQVGILASCGLIALEDWQERLKKDHDHALYLAKELKKLSDHILIDVDCVETNIFRFQLTQKALQKIDHAGFCQYLKTNHKILMNPSFKNDAIRIVTHRDVSESMIQSTVQAFKDTVTKLL